MNTAELDGHRCLIIDRLRLPFRIGVLDHEKQAPQEVAISLRLYVREEGPARSTDLGDYVSYATIVDEVRSLAACGRHIPLVENLAEEIAALALADRRVARVLVDVRKTEIVPGCAGVGVAIERRNPDRGV